MKPPPAPRWIALEDRVAHAVLPGAGQTRAACGAPKPDERYAWKARERCAPCLDAIDRLTREALGVGS